MSGLFKSTVIPGNRLTDFTQSSASVGGVMMWGFGQYVAPGNIIWAPLPPKEHRKVTRQGKGGVKQETFSYTLSHAAAFGRKRIHGYWWIERNGKIVYSQDPNAPVEDQAYSQKWLQRATLYYGTKTQLPDSTIESYEGSGQVSAFRNVPYIVLEDDDVTDNAGAAPSYRACIIASGVSYATSPPYPIEAVDEVGHDSQALAGAIIPALKPIDDVLFSSEALGGTLKKVVQKYTNPPEGIQFNSIALGGDVYARVVTYTEPPDAVQFSSVALGGNVYARLIEYSETDSVEFTSIALGGTLS